MDLNESQQRVVSEIDRNILLLASAGTGKTDTMSRRIANIIKSGRANSDEILCITFTNKAAKEMENRIKAIIQEEGNKITIRTFHSFCFDIIKREAKRSTDIFTDFVVFDEDDCRDIIKGFRPHGFSEDSIQRFINIVKEESVKKGISYNASIENIFNSRDDDINYICTENKKVNFDLKRYLEANGENLIHIYNRELSNNHGLDFNDLIIKAKEILSNENVVNYLRQKYKYINVDEVQDTSTLEYSIIESIFYDNNILICGDIFQTIYGWRGSEPRKIISNFTEKYSPIEVVFNKNYRATKNLTEASLGYLLNAFNSEAMSVYSDGLESEAKDLGDKIVFKENDSLYEEASFIYSQIKSLQIKGEDISKVCVLTRDNGYNVNLSKELSYIQKGGQGFEFVLVDQFKFFRRMEVKDIIAFLKLIGNKNDSLSLKRILKRLPTGIGDKTLEEIESSSYRLAGISLSDFIDDKTYKGEYFSLLIEEFKKDNVIIFDVESTGVDVTEDEIIQIAAIKINSKGEKVESFEKFISPKRLVKDSQFVHGFSDDFLKKNGEDKKKVLNEFLEFSKDAVIVGHNVQFDINILTSEVSREKLGEIKFKGFYDTLDIYRRFHSNVENHKLETLSNVFKTKNKPSHNAMDDILATGELLARAISEDIVPTSFERISYIAKHIKSFSDISNKLNNLFKFANENRPCDIITFIVENFNIKSLYKGEDGYNKMERIRDFYVLLKDLDDSLKSNRDSLLEVIKITSLSNGELENIIIKRSGKIRIPIITVHQSKGLEYENVFIAGLQDGKFPSYRAIKSNDIDEEKRTFYVAITRAKKRLYLSCNTNDGYYKRSLRSRFIDLIPQKYVKYDN
ncbi:3'-5' exonuclease [Clostridium cylindrosporum]|uniref:DNA 3'-5' helicase n=1 Tax=Clostridium cylindrosporum DSM 605 TaxID=1121307 RepID=A0A0J8D6R0_CLOCY|nr:3'-5' exonuclease [Clostridium cylindrosporum]KMT21770.1 ATP-dependent DNA helicase PcrA [Clostridium cylindrosporum DSM 605]